MHMRKCDTHKHQSKKLSEIMRIITLMECGVSCRLFLITQNRQQLHKERKFRGKMRDDSRWYNPTLSKIYYSKNISLIVTTVNMGRNSREIGNIIGYEDRLQQLTFWLLVPPLP